MRVAALLTALFIVATIDACQTAKSGTGARHEPIAYVSGAIAKPDFDTDIKPIFQTRCQPCHFQGGQVYDKMPFDKPETITRLGTKLFTRIKDEKERTLIREFLDGR